MDVNDGPRLVNGNPEPAGRYLIGGVDASTVATGSDGPTYRFARDAAGTDKPS